MNKPLKIRLNEDQTKKFLSIFIREAVALANKRAQKVERSE